MECAGRVTCAESPSITSGSPLTVSPTPVKAASDGALTSQRFAPFAVKPERLIRVDTACRSLLLKAMT